MLTYRDLYSYVVSEIEKRQTYNTKTDYNNQLSRDLTFANSDGARSDVGTAEVISAVQAILAETMPQAILEGLDVTATSPESNKVGISAGKGTAYGQLYEIDEDVEVVVPLDGSSDVFYINLYKNTILVEKTINSQKLTIAKVVCQRPSTNYLIYDDKDTNFNAYIVSFKEYKLYGTNDKFEEDTIELLRDNIGKVLADNIIGNIRLSENLKILNTAGTLELNSDSILFKGVSGNTFAKFNPSGLYFYQLNGSELAKFANSGARIGNITITPNSLESTNYSAGLTGFKIKDNGDAEFNDVTVRGTIYATTGEIGGWTIGNNELYATTTGTIKTGETVGVGSNGVILDKDGLRVYDDVLGQVVNLPSDGSAPTFSSGIINNTIFEINTNSILRTSETVGDGTSNSAGLLMNSTGLYGCGANQLLANANFKLLATGAAYFSGEIRASSGQIGSTTITSEGLFGGLISGTLLRGSSIETSDTFPKIKIDADGVRYQISASVGSYGEASSGSTGFLYGDGTVYGTGVTAYLLNKNFPVLTVASEINDTADIRLYNRGDDPTTGTHELGDLIVVDGLLKICSTSGTPGVFSAIGGNALTKDTFTDGDLSSGTGILTVTHNLGLTIEALIVVILDNNKQQIIPDSITFNENSFDVDLTSYGTLSGTWQYVYSS